MNETLPFYIVSFYKEKFETVNEKMLNEGNQLLCFILCL
jgi:hypothetical protein